MTPGCVTSRHRPDRDGARTEDRHRNNFASYNVSLSDEQADRPEESERPRHLLVRASRADRHGSAKTTSRHDTNRSAWTPPQQACATAAGCAVTRVNDVGRTECR